MIFSNNGERCTAGARILVQQSIYADFAAKFAERAKRITVGDPLDEKTIVGPMISQAHLAKVRSYIELGPEGRRDAAVRRAGCARAAGSREEGQLRAAHRVRRRRQPHADRAGRDLRPGGLPDPVQGRGRCDSPGQRHPVRPVELRLDREPRPRASRGRGRRGRHVLRQQPERARPAPALRRHQGLGHGARGRHLELRGVLRAEERGGVAGLASHSALGQSDHGQARARRQDHARAVDVPVGVSRARTTAAARPPSTATRKSTAAAARSAWTPSWCSTCTGRSTANTTSTAGRSSRASTPATSCRTSSRTCPTPIRATRRWAT